LEEKVIRTFEGKTPKIAESVFVNEAAYIVGDVEIGDNSSVWPCAVIRGDIGKIIIGENTHMEDNSVIHSGSPSSPDQDMIIGNNVHIGHGAVINCRKIGNNILIGMNATILHEAEIGNNCIIGASCLVSQGMKIPDNSSSSRHSRQNYRPGNQRTIILDKGCAKNILRAGKKV
jgi:carbonic anhydrase/acetyltransferase-like protein (isoleucine patch superfamily)